MATTIALTSQAGTNAPYKLGSPPDFGTLYSGRALDFDGVVDTFSVSTPITAADSYTIALWFYSDGNSSVMMWENKDATSNPSLEGSDSNWRFYSNGSTSVSTGAVSTGAWHHLVATYNESDLAMGLYLDGVLVDSDTANATTSQDIATLHIGSRAGTSKFFDGKMSNFQIWDKAWSLSDVQYAYTHPEKLITHNSAVTSGTTISNLKAWYPCTEGNPRSPQTTVYDGSPKGLGSEIIIGNNSTFDSGYGDWVPNSSDTSIEATGGALKITRIGSSGNVNVRVKIELTSSMKTTGTIWKFEWDMWKDVDTTYFECSMAGNSGSVGKAIIDLNPVSTTRQSYTGYFTQLSTGDMYFNCAMGDGVTGSYYIDNISVKEVKMGNHGTTKFYGTELVTNGDSDSTLPTINSQNLASYDVASFAISTAITGSTATYNGAVAGDDSILVTADSSSAYPLIRFLDGTDCGLVTGRTYYISCYVYLPASQTLDTLTLQALDNGSSTIALGGTGTTTTTNTWVKLYGSYVSDDPIRCFEIRGSGGDVSGEIFYIDQISIKEVGVAAGWTTADAEPLIPQTALMGMSKPMVFNGIDEHVVLDSTLVLASTDGEMSVSCWVVIDDVADASYRMIIGGTHPNLFAYCGYYHNKFKWLIDGVWNTSSRSIVASTLYHLVYTKNNTSYKFYINGSLEWSITGAGVLADMNKIGDSPNYEEHEGIINEVSAWNKELSLAQVQELFNDGVALDARTHSLSPSTGTDNLIGYWRNVGLGEWEDLSQNTNDGTPTNATDTILLPEGTTAGKDLLGFPLTVPNNGWLNITDGELNNKSLVVIPNSSVFDFTSGSFTVSFWLKPLWTKSGYNFIISKGGYLVHNGWEFRTHEDQIYQPEFTVWEDDGTRRRATSGTITYNEWVYLVGIYDISVPATYLYKVTGADTITTLATNTAVSGNISTDTRNIIIGSGSVTGWQASLGKQQFSIDEVKIYNRALEPEEITKNYKHGKSKHKN